MKPSVCFALLFVAFAAGCTKGSNSQPMMRPPVAAVEEPAAVAPAVEPLSDAAAAAEAPAKDQPKQEQWISLFDGDTLDGWKSTEFGGEGEVKVEEGAIVMELGQDMTGITWTRKDPPPKTNYEISYEANRVDGGDFFAALTFPVGESHCSFINGGWGGGVVGLSSINGFDASENDTTQYLEFKTGQWYKFRVRVTPERIQAWIDDKEVVDQDIQDRQVSTRGEVELNKPLGFSTWNTKGALRNIRLRTLEPPAGEEEKKGE
jgi:hypothetical protein